MAITSVRSSQILDATVGRVDLNVATPGAAVVVKIVAGTGITISSTGADTGTGDVTINTSSGAVAAHHTTHETGGTDVITSISGAIITSGTVPDARLSTNVALKNIDNQFVPQTFATGSVVQGSTSILYFRDTSGSVDAKVWRMYGWAGNMFIQPMSDALAIQGQPLVLDRSGNAMMGGRLQIGNTSGMSPNYPAWRNTNAAMECVLGDNSAYAQINSGIFYSVVAGTSLADLTVRGGTNFMSGVSGSGNVVMSGYIQPGGVVFPGRVDITAPASQLSWYLASHPSYGLYSNTGLYLATGNLTVAGGAISSANGASITGTLTVNTVTINVGALTLTGANGSITSYQGYFPGRVDVAGTQATWYLASHGSYGLYSNTGFYMAGYTWSAGYVTNSDARLKIDKGRVTDLSALRKVIIHDFEWKKTGLLDRGVFAQEANEIFPRAVISGEDRVTKSGELLKPWGVDYSKFVPDLIAGWQAHEVEIAELKAQLKRMN